MNKDYLKRGIGALLILFAIFQIFPSLADVLTPQPAVTSGETATTVVSENPSPEASSSTSPSPGASAAVEPSASVIYSSPVPSESATPEVDLASDKELILRAPATLPVDPRAITANLSPIAIYGKGDLLLCLNISGATLTFGQVGSGLLFQGNGTNRVRISASAAKINEILSAGHGPQLRSSNRIQGSSVEIRAVALSKADLSEEFCGAATHLKRVAITPLGLGMDTVKNGVKIK